MTRASLAGISLTRQPAVIVNSYSADVLIDTLDLVLTLLQAALSCLSLGKTSTKFTGHRSLPLFWIHSFSDGEKVSLGSGSWRGG